MEAVLHMLGLCPDSLSHLDLLDLTRLPIIDIINLLNIIKNGR
jgi:hypothetical protein